MTDLANKLAGRFLVIDGPDGVGKTTQLGLLADHLRGQGLGVCLLRDPGDTRIGDQIRRLLLDRANGTIAPMCETLLFMASRAQLVEEQIRPAIMRGELVLCDRFISATIAYQGAAGVDQKAIVRLGEIATGGSWPDLTIILGLPIETGMKRIGIMRKRLKKDEHRRQLKLFGDRMEARPSEYHRKVGEIFRQVHTVYPRPVVHLKATGSREQVFERILKKLASHIAKW